MSRSTALKVLPFETRSNRDLRIVVCSGKGTNLPFTSKLSNTGRKLWGQYFTEI
ncbi:MAG: hypothetical protein NT027_03670 [Proteobacteria bacterium]|nr:hypothetical protein [Pseudomonadota bacterium]